jgi:hypothetical protein
MKTVASVTSPGENVYLETGFGESEGQLAIDQTLGAIWALVVWRD